MLLIIFIVHYLHHPSTFIYSIFLYHKFNSATYFLCYSDPVSSILTAFFEVYESCHFELEDLPPELPPQLWDA